MRKAAGRMSFWGTSSMLWDVSSWKGLATFEHLVWWLTEWSECQCIVFYFQKCPSHPWIYLKYFYIFLPFAQLNMALFCGPATLLPTRSAVESSASCLRRSTATGPLFMRCFYAVQMTKATPFWNPSSSRMGISVVSACCNVQTCWKFQKMPMEQKGASPGCRSSNRPVCNTRLSHLVIVI